MKCEAIQMVRLTVLYNIPDETDEADFIEWRLTEHQLSNEAIPGVLATSFHRIYQTPGEAKPRYRFMTTADWADRESFENGFYDPNVQKALQQDLQRIRDAVFLVSENLDLPNKS
jgi:hypothetical protein